MTESIFVYHTKLKAKGPAYMLSQEQRTEVAKVTNDSALRLYEFYIDKSNWKHFNHTDYRRIGELLGWTARKTESNKTLLVKAGYLLIIKDTLKDSTKIYRILLGKELVNHYKDTGELPTNLEAITYKEI